eukprot:CAMPEP_0177653600 /NCGR_PEP_ID=MMETSP0447-20121125/13831_1 /TAXON_ID=0 /ORGANISM="Stygamoeba regulata, Strain BSH-02190019" /LENGTH=582 /DNA_ID=CAMNT_0019157085 /DNA_START=227 /DNA_END=1976 /DNA_ORIENTATION=+
MFKFHQKQKSATSFVYIDARKSEPSSPSPARVSRDATPVRRKVTTLRPECETLPQSEAYDELLRTEREYINDLSTIIKVFLTPLRANQVLDPDSLSKIFCNIESLLVLNSEIYENIQTNGVVKTFYSMANSLQVYFRYSANRRISINTLEKCRKGDPTFNTFLVNTQNQSECRGLDLPAWLIKPIQRICKYPLLLKALLKTDPTNSQLQEAIYRVEAAIGDINDRERHKFNEEKIAEINGKLAPFIKLNDEVQWVREGMLDLHQADGKAPVPLFIYLLSDRVIITRQKGKKLAVKASFMLSDAVVRESAGEPKQFELINGNTSYKLNAADPVMKDSWTSDIHSVLDPILAKNYASLDKMAEGGEKPTYEEFVQGLVDREYVEYDDTDEDFSSSSSEKTGGSSVSASPAARRKARRSLDIAKGKKLERNSDMAGGRSSDPNVSSDHKKRERGLKCKAGRHRREGDKASDSDDGQAVRRSSKSSKGVKTLSLLGVDGTLDAEAVAMVAAALMDRVEAMAGELASNTVAGYEKQLAAVGEEFKKVAIEASQQKHQVSRMEVQLEKLERATAALKGEAADAGKKKK